MGDFLRGGFIENRRVQGTWQIGQRRVGPSMMCRFQCGVCTSHLVWLLLIWLAPLDFPLFFFWPKRREKKKRWQVVAWWPYTWQNLDEVWWGLTGW